MPPESCFASARGALRFLLRPISEAALVVGRRGGKSRVLALIAVYLACFRDYPPYLAPGEVATIAVLAANRPQARSIFRYISGILKAVPLFARMVVDENTEAITLANRVVIEIGTASFRTTRGYSFAAVLCDEIAFWRQDETSANPDVEILGLCVPAWRRSRVQYSCWLRRRMRSVASSMRPFAGISARTMRACWFGRPTPRR